VRSTRELNWARQEAVWTLERIIAALRANMHTDRESVADWYANQAAMELNARGQLILAEASLVTAMRNGGREGWAAITAAAERIALVIGVSLPSLNNTKNEEELAAQVERQVESLKGVIDPP